MKYSRREKEWGKPKCALFASILLILTSDLARRTGVISTYPQPMDPPKKAPAAFTALLTLLLLN